VAQNETDETISTAYKNVSKLSSPDILGVPHRRPFI
jgi:hypothetical protein